jgi:CAAX prenyl protease-like protein
MPLTQYSSQPSEKLKLKPAPLRVAVPIFAATSLLFFLTLSILLPALRNRDVSWFTTFNLVLALPMLLLLFAAFALEGRCFKWGGVRDRFRLGRIEVSTVFWTAALSVFMFGGQNFIYIAFVLTVPAIVLENRWAYGASVGWLLSTAVFLVCSRLLWHSEPLLRRIPIHSEPAALQDFLSQFRATSFMGIPLKGHWWIAVYYLAVLLVGNIAGEELWWRGYLLPRQELVHGGSTWVVHGILLAAFHLFFQTTAWDFVRMLPTCCALAFVAQHKKKHLAWDDRAYVCNSGILLQILHGI